MMEKNKWIWIDKDDEYYQMNHIGMFDLTKGLGMIGIILAHSMYDYKNILLYSGGDSNLWNLLISPFLIVRYGMVAMLFLSCGYGIRKEKITKNIKKNLGLLCIPYLAVTLVILLLTLIECAISESTSLRQGLFYQVLPFLMGLHPGQHRLGSSMEQIGPIWFFLTYILASIYLNLILQEKQKWVQALVMLIGSMVGVIIAGVILPFCMQQVLICSGYMFVGIFLKKGRILHQKMPLYLILLTYLLCTFTSQLGGLIETGSNTYYLGAIDLIISYIAGIVLLWLCQRLEVLQGRLPDFLRWIGRHMMWFCCVHTISYLMVPWKRVAEWFGDRKVLGCLFEFTTSFVYALIVCWLLEKLLRKFLYKQRK